MIQADISQRDADHAALTQLMDRRTSELTSLELTVGTSSFITPYLTFEVGRLLQGGWLGGSPVRAKY